MLTKLDPGKSAATATLMDEAPIRPAQGPTIDEGAWSRIVSAPAFGNGLNQGVDTFFSLGRSLAEGPFLGTWLARNANVGAGERTGFLDTTATSLLEWADLCECVLVLTKTGASLLRTADLKHTPAAHPLDERSQGKLVLQPLPSGQDLGSSAAEAIRAQANVLISAHQVGVAQGALDLAVAHAKQRVQFGRPIGSFQALKHMLADLSSLILEARAATLGATDDVARGTRIAGIAQRSARLLSDHAALEACRISIQVHGAPGFAWHHPLNTHLRRAIANSATIDTRGFAAEVLAQFEAERSQDAATGTEKAYG